MKRVLVFTACLVFPWFGAVAAYSVAISPRFPVAASTHHQLSFSAAFDGTNYLFAVQGDALGSGSIGAQFVSQSGTLVGPLIATGHSSESPPSLDGPTVAFGGADYLLVWSDYANPSNVDVYGCLIAPSGARGQPFVISQAAGGQYEAHAASDGTNYLVVWTDSRNSTHPEIYGQLVSPSGSLLGPEIHVAVQQSENQKEPDVAFDGSRYLVVWESRRIGNPELHDIYGCFVTKSGLRSDPFLISQTPSPRYNPLEIAFGNTGYLVVWNKDMGPGYPSPSVWDVYGRMISTSGSFQTPEFAVTSAAGSQIMPCVAFDGRRFLVAWTDVANANDANVYGRFVSGSGTLEGSGFPVILDAGGQLAYPLVSCCEGRFLLGFIEGDFASQSDVYGLFLNEDGNSASGVKRNPDGTRVVLTDKVVTAVASQPANVVYVQEPDRSSGIRVSPDTLPTLSIGDVVTVYGNLSTTEGERVTSGATITRIGSTTAPIPLGMTNKSQGGSDWYYDAGTGAGQQGVTGGNGLNNVGLLVRTWGQVKEFDPTATPTWFVIDDGSGVDVRCEVPSGVAVHRTWTYVAVTGISRLYKVGNDYKHRISVRNADDITVVKENPPDAPSTVLGFDTNDAPWITLVANWPDGATSMKVYQSADKVTWTPTSIPVQKQDFGWGPYGLARFEQSSRSFFRFTAANSGGESTPSDVIHARPSEVEYSSIVVDVPNEGQTGVSRTPTFTWHQAWSQPVSLKRYYCDVVKGSTYEDMWWVGTLATPPQTSLVFGQTEGVTTCVPASGPLAPYTEYSLFIEAFDSENWEFALSGDRHFTTGP